jgi:beta-galactosidase
MVFINGAYAGQQPYGYSSFTVALDPFLRYGETNTIRVDARVQDGSRWYSGGGAPRPFCAHAHDSAAAGIEGSRIAVSAITDPSAIGARRDRGSHVMELLQRHRWVSRQ